jgi:cytochrome c biogenesis protein CcmG, thiol:disulfide interchange protein DsbE
MKQRPLVLATIGIFAVVVIAAALYYFFGPEHRRVQTASQSPIVGKAQVGQPAPTFQVATTHGLFDLSKTDKPVFLEVFATWCPHCQRMTVVVDNLFRRFGGAVDFVGVSGSDTAMDGVSTSSELDVLQWAQRFHVQYPVAYDPLLNVANLYLQGGFPTFAVIGKDKKVAYLDSGEVSYNDLAAAIAKVLR